MAIQPSQQSVDYALAWHTAIIDSVRAHRSQILAAIAEGISSIPPRFFGLTVSEVEQFFVNEALEVDGMSIVNIVAAAETAIRADFRERVRRNRSDPLTREYAAYASTLSGLKLYRPDFDRGGILEALKNAKVVPDHLITAFRHALQIRHWYAHGRHWLLRSTVTIDPVNVHVACTDLINAIVAV